MTNVVVRTVAGGNDGPNGSGQIAAGGAEQWKQRWSQSGAPATTPDVSSVDFADAVAVGLFAGEKSTGGWRIEVGTPVAGGGGEVRLPYVVIGPGKGCFTTQALTAPYLVVAVEGVANPDVVVFEPSQRLEDC